MANQDEIIEIVKRGQDRDRMLYNALKVIIRLYANKPHFIFELLQNAEDCGATKVLFIQHTDSLEFLHDGKPFTKSNLQAICDISESDKVYTDIGKFGVGFKSVYGICESVLLFSHPLEETENYPRLHLEIKGFIEPKAIDDQPMPEGYTTRFVLPFVVGKDFSNFKDIQVLRSTIEKALKGVGAETLLFMKSLKKVSYRIDGEEGAEEHTFSLKKEHPEGKPYTIVTSFTSTEDKTCYLVFSKKCSKQEGRTVDIAYPFVLEDGKRKFVESQYPNIFVYFPTETESKLSFVVQGPFKTTPDRAKVPFDDEENIDLVQDLRALYHDSILILRDEKEVDYDFIRIMALQNSSYDFFSPIVDESWFLLRSEPLLLTDAGDEYVTPDRAHIVRGQKLVELFPDSLLTELVNDGKEHRWLPTYITENSSDYRCLFDCFTRQAYYVGQRTLGIPVEKADELKPLINKNPAFLPNRSEEWLISFYNHFSDMKDAFSEREGNKNLRLANIVKTSKGLFVSPYSKNEKSGRWERNIFLPSKRGIEVPGVHIVDSTMLEKCQEFFMNVLILEEPDDFEAFKNEFSLHMANPDEWTQQQRLDDLIMITLFMEDERRKEDALSVAKNAKIIRAFKNGIVSYEVPEETFMPKDNDGNDLAAYLKDVPNVAIVDINYYQANGISRQLIEELGSKATVIDFGPTGGRDYFAGRQRITAWNSIGLFRWRFEIDYLKTVLRQILENPFDKSSKLKSKYIFSVLKRNQNCLDGEINVGTSYSETRPFKSKILETLASENALWIYTKNGELTSPCGLSVSEMDSSLYGVPNPEDTIFNVLGMVFDGLDKIMSAIALLPPDQQEEVARRLGQGAGFGITTQFQNPQFEETDFPERQVKNWDLLRAHVQEELISATPVRYQEILRSIRVTKNDSIIKTYLDDMYQTKHACVCQACRAPRIYTEKAQIEGKGDMELEIRSLFLRLCPDCAARFRGLRMNKDLVEQFRETIKNLTEEEIMSQSPVVVKFGDMEISFTQTHIAEIREVFRELDKPE